MNLDEMRERAKAEIQGANPGATDLNVTKEYENIMDGRLVTVSFKDKAGKDELSHVLFDSRGGYRIYRYHSDVLNEVAHYKERRWFFRFLEFAGVGGLIAFTLVLIFSVVLSILAFSCKEGTASIVEVVKLSFTTILGYFFGSQGKK